MRSAGGRPRVTRFPRAPRRPGTSLIDTNRWRWSALRRTILIRDRWTCQYCGAEATTVDHVVRREHGGGDDSSNLRAACRRCQYPELRPTLLRFADVPASASRATASNAARIGARAAIRPILGEMTVGMRPRQDERIPPRSSQ